MKIYISGLYSGTNPQPGIGIARSLRQAYPQARLVGVEYSNRCSGIHWHDFDEIWLQRPWEELNLKSHGKEIEKILEAGGLWISANDLEVIWLASVFPDGHANLLTPSSDALSQVSKPAITAHKLLPVGIPVYVTNELSDWDLHAFCRQNDWKVWLKGPYYEAVRAGNWAEFQDVRVKLSKAWSTDKLFLQSHVTGYEESISLSAYNGELLSSVQMRKRDLTEISKTWAGEISPVPAELLNPLRQMIKELNWTGGAELEMVRDADDQLWLLEINPRYPAWIHGATIAGHNLPAGLIEGATGLRAQKSPAMGDEFTRVVLEVPVRHDYPLPSLPEPFGGGIGHSLKHPSGLLGFANRLHEAGFAENNNCDGHGRIVKNDLSGVPKSFVEDITEVDFQNVQTPSFLFLEKTACRLFRRAGRLSKKLSTDQIQLTNAYSIKTNPDGRLIKLAREAGFLVETISLLEVDKALKAGFKSNQIILNGPGKWWRREFLPAEPLRAVFCDSVADLRRLVASMLIGELKAEIAGVRLRTPNFPSRFGIPIDTPEVFKTLIDSIEILPRECGFGIHFHMASSNVGVEKWWHLFESVLKWCSSIEALSGRIIQVLDVGGGWFPDDWQDDSDAHFAKAVAKVQEYLPHVQQIISEPGKALAQPSMALAMRILEIQDFSGAATDVVVDGSIAELPMYFLHPHRILYQNARTGMWQSLGRGKAHLLGRLCMENDIVASNVNVPMDAEPGDLLVFCDAGAYDRSMSYAFGRG